MFLQFIIKELRYRKTTSIVVVLVSAVVLSVILGGKIIFVLYQASFTRSIEQQSAEIQKSWKHFSDRYSQVAASRAHTISLFAQGVSSSEILLETVGIQRFTFSDSNIDSLLALDGVKGVEIVLKGYARAFSTDIRVEITGSRLYDTHGSSETLNPATVRIGYELADKNAIKIMDTIQINTKPFTISAITSEQGSRVDRAIEMSLEDAQTVLKQPQWQISEIRIMQYLDENRFNGLLAEQIKKQFPDLTVHDIVWSKKAGLKIEKTALQSAQARLALQKQKHTDLSTKAEAAMHLLFRQLNMACFMLHI